MVDDFYPFVDSGDPAPNNNHIAGALPPQPAAGGPLAEAARENGQVSEDTQGTPVSYATRIAVYDDMLSTPRVIVITPKDVRTYLEEITNTVYRCMKEQGGTISLMVIREIVENFIHAHFVEPIISILDNGATIRFADQGPGIEDKERAFEFGVTSADRDKKRFIRGTGAGFPMVQQYLENAGGAVSIEDNLGQGTVVTVSLDPARVGEIKRAATRGAAVRSGHTAASAHDASAPTNQSPYGTAAAEAPVPYGATATSPQQPYMPAAVHAPGAFGQPYGQAAPAPAVQTQEAQAAAAGASYPSPMQPAEPTIQQGAGGIPGQPLPGAYPQAPGTQPMQQSPYPYPYPPQQPGAAAGVQNAGPAAPQAQSQFWGGYGYPAPGMNGGWPAYAQQAYAPGMYQPAGAYPQQAGWPEPAYPGNPWQHPAQAPLPASAASATAQPYVSERGMLALQYLEQHDACGPTDLERAFGSSAPTWSRELETLTGAGLVIKRGQKRTLTDMGRVWLQNLQPQQG